MDSFPFARLKSELGAGFDWTHADVWLLLVDEAAAPDPDPNADTLDALAGMELDTDGYARQPIDGRSVFRDDVDGVARWLADSVTFDDLGPSTDGPTVGGAIVFVSVDDDDATSWPALALGDVVGATSGTAFTVAFGAEGVATIGAG